MKTLIAAALLVGTAAVFAQVPPDASSSDARTELLNSPAITQATELYFAAREQSAAGNHAAALPMQEKILALMEQTLGPDDIAITPTLLNLARTLAFLGQYERTLPLHGRALAIRERVMGPEHPDTAEAVSALAMSHWALGQHEKVLPLQLRALAIYEKLPGQEGMVAFAQKNLAATYSALAQYDKALPFQIRILSFMERVYGNESANTLEVLNDLATTFTRLSRPTEALPVQIRALAIQEKVWGPDHPDTAISLNNLAQTYAMLSQYDKALPLHLRALFINEMIQGSDHPATAISLGNLASTYESIGQIDKSLKMNIRALEIFEKVMGPDHPDTAISLNNLAQTHARLSQYDKALPLQIRALAIKENVFGPDHPETALSLGNLALTHKYLGKIDKALPLELRALAIFEKVMGPDHPATATALNNLAETYRALALFDKVLPLQLGVLAIREKMLGPDHPETAISLNNLAGSYNNLSQHDKALPLQLRALAIREKILGPDHLGVAISLSNLAETYRSLAQIDKVLPLQLRALAIREGALESDHLDTALLLSNLAGTYEDFGEADKGLQLKVRALAIRERVLGSDHPVTAQSFGNLAFGFRLLRQPVLEIKWLKLAINAYQTQRGRVSSIGAAELSSYTESVFGAYKALSDVLTDQGRFAEAQQVLDMLKEDEQFDFIRRAASADPRKTKMGVTGTEKVWMDRYRQIADRLGALGKEEQVLQKQAKLGLTPEEQQRQKALAADLQVAQAAFMSFVGEMRDSFVQQGLARKVEVEEVSAQALRETQGLLKGLGDDTALLQYYITENRVGMLLTTSGVQLARSSSIDSKELNQKIGEFRRLLQDPKSNPLPVAQALYQVLVAPIAKDLEDAGAKTVMLSLDGALRYLPFSALHDGKQYLVQRWNLPLYTSVTKNKLRDAVAPQWQAAGLGVTRAWPEFKPLAGVKAEMGGIVKTRVGGVMPGEVYLDEAFTALRLKDVSQRKFSLVHVASHFRFSPGTEVNSFLLLGDGERLTLGDIRIQNYRFDNVDLLTLSACDTGLGGGRDEQGREIEGFGVIAQQQGAKAVLATLWPVADQSTAILMADLYRRRQSDSLTKIEAIRQSQIALQSQSKYVHPYYWAPFILMGNWK